MRADNRDVEAPRDLVQRLIAGERRALAQAITVLEAGGPGCSPLIAALKPHLSGICVIGITGPPGAGKSTLVNALIKRWRRQGLRIAVIAVDPSSPISGGAILGDRIRMDAAIDDDGIFVRSLGSAGHLGGLSPAAVRIIDAFDAAGFDLVLLETVGTGQNEIDIAAVSNVAVVIAAPGLGDGVQAMKSGLLEIADVLVVNKADRPDARRTAEQLAAAVSLRAGIGRAPDVLETSAHSGHGVDDLADLIRDLSRQAGEREPPEAARQRRARYIVERQAVEAIRAALDDAENPGASVLVDQVLAGGIDAREAARRLLSQPKA
jgi:LAO/AO transport system kinase